MANDMDALTAEEKASFRLYAEESRTEPDGTESQWASFTLRLLSENERLEKQLANQDEDLLTFNAKVADVARLTAELRGTKVSLQGHVDGLMRATEENQRLTAEVEEAKVAHRLLLGRAEQAEAALAAEQAAHSATKEHEDLLRKLLAERQAEVRQLRADYEALKATDAEIQRDQIAKTAALAAAQKELSGHGMRAHRCCDEVVLAREALAAANERAEKEHLRGWQEAVESVRASLREYPNGGGDVEIMKDVQRLTAPAPLTDEPRSHSCQPGNYPDCCDQTDEP